jgi:hypothetical protein
MPLQNFQALTATDIPQPHHMVIAATSESLTIPTKSNRPNTISVRLQNFQALTATDIAEPYLAIATATS